MNQQIIIENKVINDQSDCYVIAEIGHNHMGRLDKCMELFRAAKECGADAVKLQKRHNKSLFTAEIYNSPYPGPTSYGDTYGEHREALEFGLSEYRELVAYAKELELTFFSTAFDFKSADFLAELDMPAYKIASGDLNNTPLLKHVAKIGKPMIVSTGGGTMDDIRRAHDAVMPINDQLAFLQCTAVYPVEPEDMNLRVIETLRREFPDVIVGLSDHQNGIAMSEIAYILGARIVEKHFTLNRAWRGTDHAFSLEPAGLRRLVRDLKRARLALGDGEKKVLPMETKALFKMAKKLVAATDLPAGRVLTRTDVAVKSPNNGLPPYELDNLIGRRTKRDLAADENIMFEDLD